MASVSISYRRRKFARKFTVRQLDNFTIRELCFPLENYLRVFFGYIVVVHITVFKVYRLLKHFVGFSLILRLTGVVSYLHSQITWLTDLKTKPTSVCDRHMKSKEVCVWFRSSSGIAPFQCIIHTPICWKFKKKRLLNSSHWFPFLNCHPLNK